MKIVVIGGSGLIGSKLVSLLRARHHEAIAASPASGVNTITGEGLVEVLRGAQVVVDVANSPSFEDRAVLEFFQTSGRNLLAAETAAGVKHHVALSVVGTERLAESGYFRGKIAQEKLIRESGIPYTIVHATQFFEFLGSIAQAATEGQQVRLSTAFVQPIASSPLMPQTDLLGWTEMTRAIGYQGIPVETVIYGGGAPASQQTVSKIERTAIPANAFDLPTGLTKQDLSGIARGLR